ncbi:MAG: OmpA family protein [Gammaproteobacteria bacterium]|nr:OmpA family protein [Gammaproteobacteria bacterium]
MRNIVAVGLIAVTAAGCVSTPRHSDQLDEARAQVQALSQEPLAQQAAADDLRAAQGRLQEAEAALEHGEPLASVDHSAYLAERHAEAGEARVRAASAREDLARAQDERNQILLSSRAHEAEVQAREARSAREQLAQTQEELAALKARQTDRGMVLTLGADVLFDTGSAALKPGADLSLDRLATYLRSHPQTRILVEGNTDSRGSDEYNDALSERRAQSVANALTTRGVSADAIRTIGRGKAYPVASNDTDAGRQQNRRVDIVFSDASGRFAQGDTEPATR